MQDSPLLRKRLYTLLRGSFEHSQGSQELQADLVLYAAKLWRERGELPVKSLRDSLIQYKSMKTPRGHAEVDSYEVQAQFRLWWHIMWDILEYESAPERRPLPSADSLLMRASSISDKNSLMSFSDEKIINIANRLHWVSKFSSSQLIITGALLPKMLIVEKSYQVDQPYHPVKGRQRTDGGDRCESKLLTHCVAANSRVSADYLDVFLFLYAAIAQYLERISLEQRLSNEEQETYNSYRELVELYNSNHPESYVPSYTRR